MELLNTNEMGEGTQVLSYFSIQREREALVYSGTGETQGSLKTSTPKFEYSTKISSVE